MPLLEAHDLAGGNTQVFRRHHRNDDGTRTTFEFDVGIHYIGEGPEEDEPPAGELRGEIAGYLDAVARHRDGGFQQPGPWQLPEFLVHMPETGHGSRHARREVAVAGQLGIGVTGWVAYKCEPLLVEDVRRELADIIDATPATAARARVAAPVAVR